LSSRSTISWRRFEKPRKSARRKVQMISHGEIGTSITTPPATARNTNPLAIAITSRMTMSLSEYV